MTKGLEQLEVLLGDWIGESKKYSEGRGHMKVAPAEGCKFVLIDTLEEHDIFPHSIQLVGSDDSRDECTALYYDARRVRRVYQMRVVDGVWTIWRDAPGFNQRFTGNITDDGQTIAGQWEISEDGKSWEVDFDLTYTKVRG